MLALNTYCLHVQLCIGRTYTVILLIAAFIDFAIVFLICSMSSLSLTKFAIGQHISRGSLVKVLEWEIIPAVEDPGG
jgi:hypothetical protein